MTQMTVIMAFVLEFGHVIYFMLICFFSLLFKTSWHKNNVVNNHQPPPPIHPALPSASKMSDEGVSPLQQTSLSLRCKAVTDTDMVSKSFIFFYNYNSVCILFQSYTKARYYNFNAIGVIKKICSVRRLMHLCTCSLKVFQSWHCHTSSLKRKMFFNTLIFSKTKKLNSKNSSHNLEALEPKEAQLHISQSFFFK